MTRHRADRQQPSSLEDQLRAAMPTTRLPEERAAAIRAAIRQHWEQRRHQRSSRRRSLPGWSWAPVAALLVLALGATWTSRLGADPEWSQWRGPARDGRSPETGLLQDWPSGGPPLAWQAEDLGWGFASVSVAGRRLFTMGDLDDGQFVLALDAADGRRIWRTRIGPAFGDAYFGPRATPTVADSRVYVLSTEGQVVALDTATGEILWRRDLVREFGGTVMRRHGASDWKWSESPLVDGERVVITPGARDAAMVALHAETGAEIWKVRTPDLGNHGEDGAGYASAVISEGAGVRQYVQLLGRGLIGVEATTGRYLWGYNRVANEVANIPTPIVHGDLVFASTGYGTGAVLLELVRRDDRIDAREIYFLDAEVMQNHHGGMVLHEGHVFTASGHNGGQPLCLELATGRVVWRPDRRMHQSAAILYADDRLYFRYQNGRMVLVEASASGYREHGSFQIPGPRRASWPHPVIAGGLLYLREQGRIFAYDVSAPG